MSRTTLLTTAFKSLYLSSSCSSSHSTRYFSTTLNTKLATTSSSSSSSSSTTPTTSSASLSSSSTSTTTTTVEPQERETTTTTPWTAHSKRSGVLARKLGMTTLWSGGTRVPVTVLHLDQVQVVESRSYPSTSKTAAHHSIIVACSSRKRKTTNRSLLGQFDKARIEPKLRIAEFKVTQDALIPAGTTFSSAHFVPGQYVDVQAPSIGKGFQGVMKRHNFKGLRATHGTSISHRSHGSTGQHQDPGRVWPGKKMAGRMGGNLVTIQNLLVYRIDTKENVLYVKGAVPGAPGSFVRVNDALKKVGWKALTRQKFGIDLEKQEILEGIKALPFPVGSVELCKTLDLPREIQIEVKNS